MSSLPKIMYDQTQFTPLWMVDHNGLWLSDKSYTAMAKISGYTPNRWLVYTQNKPESFWFGAYDQTALDQEAVTGFANFNDKQFIQEFEAAVENSYQQAKEISKTFFAEFYGRELETLNTEPGKVTDFIQQIHNLADYIMGYYFLTQPQRFYLFEGELAKYLPNKDLEHASTTGRHLTKIAQIQKFIFDLASAVKQSGGDFDSFLAQQPEWSAKVDQTIESLGFLNWGLLGGDLADKNYIKKAVNELLSDGVKFAAEQEKISVLVKDIESRKSFMENNSSAGGVSLADAMGQSSVMRFDLQTFMLCTINYVSIFIKLTQQKHQLSDSQIASYFYDEVISLIDTGTVVDPKILEQRQKGFLKIFSDQGIKSYIAEEAHAQIKDLLEFRTKEINTTKEVAGTVASWPSKETTKISGRAFVLTTAFDAEAKLADFRPGDILVATQTHPNLVPIMKEALAIITDEGGITCHAAIVSRELKKPCLIGTKLGTKIFKTGDTIEINISGAQGSVKKI